ncbi:SRPBCC domain-containing protein [Arthrobacter dokdonensis]|uniref:SRPBCC domain-containing protein n=1 Tax=Arthrobacter dokdonellae TaxID=2211210 RepID=UPI000DE5926C|nr:SRPBCC domain-containing protein [Arthrobacter dokdonellae]
MTISDALTGTTTQVCQVLIRASAQRIWDAITTPEFTIRYFHGARVQTTGETGTPFRYYAPDGTTLWGGEIIQEADPPHKLAVPLRSLYDADMAAEPRSRGTWLIEEQGRGVCLPTAVHDRLENSPTTAKSIGGIGWLTVIDGLKTLLESGQPLFDADPPARPEFQRDA